MACITWEFVPELSSGDIPFTTEWISRQACGSTFMPMKTRGFMWSRSKSPFPVALRGRPSGGSGELAVVNDLHYPGIGGPGLRGHCDPSHAEWDTASSLLELVRQTVGIRS